MDFWLPPKPAIIRPAPADMRQNWRREPKKANFVPGWHPGAVAGPNPPDFRFTDNGVDDSNLLAYTFTARAIGAADIGRRIFVAATSSATSINAHVSAVTIGGVSATIHAEAGNTGNTRNGVVAIASAIVPSGTTADVVVTHTADLGVLLGCHISVYRATGLVSGTPFDTATTDNAGNLLLDIPVRGFVIACAATVSGPGHTWPSPEVEDRDAGSDGVQLSSAHTPVQFTATTNYSAGPSAGGGSGASRYAAVSWA